MFMMYLSLKPFVTITFCTSSLLLLAIMSQVIILFCVVSDCHWLTWNIDETMRVSMIQMMSKWRTPYSESMFSESDSMYINGCMFCSIDVMKCIQALAWICLLRFLLSMQHMFLFSLCLWSWMDIWYLSSFLWNGCCMCDILHDEALHRGWDGPSGFSAYDHWGVLQRSKLQGCVRHLLFCVHDISIF